MANHKVQLRGGFSDRNKIEPINTELQTEDFDDRTKTAIINLLRSWTNDLTEEGCENFYIPLLKDVFCEYIDDQMTTWARFKNEVVFNEYIYPVIKTDHYGNVLTIVEYICNSFENDLIQNYDENFNGPIKFEDFDEFEASNRGGQAKQYTTELNDLFEREFVGYRMIDGKIVAVTDPVEAQAIEDSLDIEFQGPKSHIQKALGFLADREHKDYKNSIKESISAVESICKIIAGKENATLGDALKILESKRGLKGQLKAGFEKLYNYTNDQGGIRHAEGLFESNITFEEAKYMLVSCCAFVNYLIAEYGKTK